jgi:Zn-finger protein
MTYEQWIEQHKAKHHIIMEKLTHLSDSEVIEYFDFENMRRCEPDFCLLYGENKKCHEMEQLNCYFCACPLFRLGNTKSFCKIESRFGGEIVGDDGFIHQDCTRCKIPHKVSYIEKNFDRDWENAMRDVKLEIL